MDDVESIGALAEPVRRALYEWVVAQAEPVSRDQAAAGAGVPRHTAKFHLDKLVADGLLETEFRRLTGRRGPGAGRPAKLYRRSPRQVVGHAAAAAVRAGRADHGRGARPRRRTPRRSPRRPPTWGAARARPSRRSATSRTSATGVVELLNCPFHALAQEHTALVCGMNLHLVGALLEGTDRRAVLDPAPGRCCVTVVGDEFGRPDRVDPGMS